MLIIRIILVLIFEVVSTLPESTIKIIDSRVILIVIIITFSIIIIIMILIDKVKNLNLFLFYDNSFKFEKIFFIMLLFLIFDGFGLAFLQEI